MLIDARKVLYSVKDKKLVYPEIPTEGLVCYLDARGKYNTDVYRNTLLDLSGNGNHGTLQNFNFTEESGYVKGLSGGTSGLRFDGVDDYLEYSHNLEETDPRTIFIDVEIEQTATEQGVSITLPFGLIIHNANNYIHNMDLGAHFNAGVNSMVKGTHKFVITIESTVETGKMYYKGQVYANNPQTSIGSYHFDPRRTYGLGKKTLNRAMLYNRVLTDEEITQLMEV